MNGYWRGSQWIPGATVKTGGIQGTGRLELEVAAACARCVEGRSEPLPELEGLLVAYPVLKGSREQLLTPLAHLYAEEVLRRND